MHGRWAVDDAGAGYWDAWGECGGFGEGARAGGYGEGLALGRGVGYVVLDDGGGGGAEGGVACHDLGGGGCEWSGCWCLCWWGEGGGGLVCEGARAVGDCQGGCLVCVLAGDSDASVLEENSPRLRCRSGCPERWRWRMGSRWCTM